MDQGRKREKNLNNTGNSPSMSKYLSKCELEGKSLRVLLSVVSPFPSLSIFLLWVSQREHLSYLVRVFLTWPLEASQLFHLMLKEEAAISYTTGGVKELETLKGESSVDIGL